MDEIFEAQRWVLVETSAQGLAIEQARLDLDRKRFEDELRLSELRLELDKEKARSESHFLQKNFGTFVTALVSISAVIVSLSQVYLTYLSKEKEIASGKIVAERQLDITTAQQKRDWSLKATEFIATHQDVIFSQDTEKRTKIANVMLVTFPPEITAVLFQKLSESTSDANEKKDWISAQSVATKLLLVRIDGLYQYKSNNYNGYLRFYPEGMVAGVSSTGTPAEVARWLSPTRTGVSKGQIELKKTAKDKTFEILGTTVKFSLTSEAGTVDYEGAVAEDKLKLTVHSKINGHIGFEEYEFIRLND